MTLPDSHTDSYVYNGLGMRLTKSAPTSLYSYMVDHAAPAGLSYYGSSYAFTFDDEDHLTGVTGPNGLSDTFAYNGLGQRVAKTDSTGQYALVSDGNSPAADVLADGVSVYTPGLSSRKGSSSEFRHGDLLGSLRFLTDANQNVVANRLFSAFGSTVASSGDASTPFGWVGDGESQTDADTGLVLMGHRLYDDRIGRFLSQDPAGEGDNWYAYADNDPVDETDPSGLISTDQTMSHDLVMGFMGGLEYGESGFGGADSFTVTKYTDTYRLMHDGSSAWVYEPGSDVYSQEDFTFSMGGTMFAGGGKLTPSQADRANWLSKTIDNIERDLEKRKGELREDPGKLAERVAGDKVKPSSSRWGHRMIMNELKKIRGQHWDELKSILEKANIATEGILDDVSADFGFVYFDPNMAKIYMERRYPGGA